MPNVGTLFPVILLNPVDVVSDRWSVTPGNNDTVITMVIEVMVHIDSSSSVLDTGRDNVYETLNSAPNQNTLYGSDNLILDSISDAGNTERDINDQTYLIATLLATFRI